MKTTIQKTTLAAAITTTLIACGGGGGGLAGIGGSGFISNGTVTGFGSIFVNGVEFETDNATFDIDDSGSGTQNDLAVGMVVTVTGTVNSDGVTGNATSVSFDDQLQGPVSNLQLLAGNDGEKKSFVVLGTTVIISAIDTIFDVTGALTGTPFDFGTIANGNNVEINGFFNDNGELVATRVELKATSFSTSNIVELKGTITNLMSTDFTVNGITVDASSAVLDDLPGGLANGASVEVKGSCIDPACTTLTATRVEGQSGFDNADKISVEGIITDYVDDSSFKINGINVDASNTQSRLPSTLTLRDGLRVEVEGPISNNTIQAIKVEIRGGNAKVHATVSSIDTTTGNFAVTVNGHNSQPQTIAITVDTATQTEGTVNIGSFVRVRGFENDTGGVTATRVEVRQSADDVRVQGNVAATDFVADTSITVLGATFGVDTLSGSPETDFENEMDTGISQTEFVNRLANAAGSLLVKVRDRDNGGSPLNGVADEIDIETP